MTDTDTREPAQVIDLASRRALSAVADLEKALEGMSLDWQSALATSLELGRIRATIKAAALVRGEG